MNVSADLLPGPWYRLADLLVLALVVWAVRRAPWHRLRDDTGSHVFLGACVVLVLFWSLRPPGLRGVEFHFLGMTGLTLLLGVPLALVAGAAVLLVTLLLAGSGLPAYSVNFLVLVALPIAVSRGLLTLAERWLPPNLFVYIFGPAFLGSALAMAAGTGASIALTVAFAGPENAAMALEFLPYCYLLSFAEATLTGMVITLMVVYRPSWVGTFDDARYLRRR